MPRSSINGMSSALGVSMSTSTYGKHLGGGREELAGSMGIGTC